MKSLKEYLIESAKTYKFKIRTAGELPENFEDKLERALNKYQVVSFSKGKKTPITERPLDFPQLQNCETTSFDVEISYPTTSSVLESYLTLDLNFPDTHLIVRGEHEATEEYQNKEKDDKPYESLLTKTDLEDNSAQKNVGANRIMDLLKELETAKKERDLDPIAGIQEVKENKWET